MDSFVPPDVGNLTKIGHQNFDNHLIEKSIAPPTVVTGIGAAASLGTSPYPAREDHSHGFASGTAFPTTPAPQKYDQFVRTDLDFLCVYDGTQWVLMAGDGTYLPTITNVNIGSTGTRNAEWSYQGYVDGGVLTLNAEFLLNGAGFAVTGAPIFSMPANFTIDATFPVTMPQGQVIFIDATAGDIYGYVRRNTSTSVVVQSLIDLATRNQPENVAAGTPFVWAITDGLNLQAVLRGIMVVP